MRIRADAGTRERVGDDDGALDHLREIDLLPLDAELVRPPHGRLIEPLRRGRHAPARQGQLAHAVRGVSDDRGGVIREDARMGRQVARAVPHGLGQGDDGGLAFGVAVEVAHGDTCQQNKPPLMRALYAYAAGMPPAPGSLPPNATIKPRTSAIRLWM